MEKSLNFQSNFIKFFYLLSFILTNNSFGVECPKENNSPLCPNSGSTLLDETYPIQAFVISNSPQKDCKAVKLLQNI